VQVSYAQHFEDLVLDRVFAGRDTGFYVDVGAGDPLEHSVTHLFYERGWRGINIEPDRRLFERLVAARPRDVNLAVAIGERVETRRFYESSVLGLSSLDPESASMAAARGDATTATEVAVETLAEVCRRHADAPIDFLKVDVEGWERAVLASNDWRRFRPTVVLVEATEPNTTIPSHAAWEGLLLAEGYVFAGFDGLNRFYVEGAQAALAPILAAPRRFLVDGALLGREVALQRIAERYAREAGEAELVRQAAEARAEAAVQRASLSEQRAVAAEAAYAAWARSPVGRLAHFLRLHRRRLP
jgi:FkbM family methyltransferase